MAGRKIYKLPKIFNDFEVPIIGGIIGFFVAFLLLKGCSTNIDFRQMEVDGEKHAVVKLLQTRVHFLDTLILETEKIIQQNKCTPDSNKKPSCIQLFDTLKAYKNQRRLIQTEIYNLKYNNADSLPAWYASYLTTDPEQLRRVIEELKTDTTLIMMPVDSLYLQKGNSNPITLCFESKPAQPMVDYFSRNTAMAYWLILTLAQMCFWVTLALMLIGWANTIIPNMFRERQFVKSLVSPLLAVLVFILLFYFVLIDKRVISNATILDGFNDKMLGYAIVGYAIAIVCFAIYISAARELRSINNEFKLLLATPDSELVKHKKGEVVADYKKVEGLFNGAFVGTAIILSLFILWLAILYNGINGMEAMQFYTRLSHRPYLNGDMVYLVGLFHTVLLLLFYVPVRLKFNSLQIMQDDSKTGSGDSVKKWIKYVGESLGTILITTSPLLTGLIEKGLSSLF